MEVFEQAASGHFEPRTAQHLKQAFPKQCESLGDDGIRGLVSHGRRRAKRYRLTSQSEVYLFIDLMFLLGKDFDDDPQLPWAGKALRSADVGGEPARARRLHAEAIAYLDRVCGPNSAFVAAAQQRLLATSIEVPPGQGRLEEAVLARLKAIWPEKYKELGDDGARHLIQRGVASAKTHDITGERGCLVFVVLMFLLGSGFAGDPLASWAGVILGDREQPQDARVRALFAGAIDHLKQQAAAGDFRPAAPGSSTIASPPRPRPVHGQEAPGAAGLACVRMVIHSVTGDDFPEKVLRQQSAAAPCGYAGANGARFSTLPALLRANRVADASEAKCSQSLDDLQRATAAGNTPAIIHLTSGGGRCVVLDEVRTNPDGSKMFLIRDPAVPEGPREISGEDLDKLGYSKCAILTGP